MKIDIELNSLENENGAWMPAADIFIHEGDKTRHLGWRWEDKEFESKEAADFYAKFCSKQKLIREGYQKDEIFLISNRPK